jgi:hypothetical protein
MEEHLVQEIARRFKRTPASRRIVEVKEFIGRSSAHRDLIKKVFPDLYREVQGSPSSGGGLSEPHQPAELCAKPQ